MSYASPNLQPLHDAAQTAQTRADNAHGRLDGLSIPPHYQNLAWNSLGSVVFAAFRRHTTAAVGVGSHVAGGNLFSAGIQGNSSTGLQAYHRGGTLPGTWMLLGHVAANTTNQTHVMAVFKRIA